MNLRWHTFERPARRLIKSEIAKSPALKKLRRQAPRKKLRALWLMLGLYFWVFIPLGLGRGAVDRIGSGPLVYALASAPLIAFAAIGFCGHLDRISDPVWHVYPFAPAEVFRERLRTFAWTLVYFAPIVLGGSAGLYMRGEIQSIPAAIVHGLVQTAMIVISGLHVTAYFQQHRGKIGWNAVLFVIVLILGTFIPTIADKLRDSSSLILAILPAGWIHHVVSGLSWREWIYLLPILILCIALPQSLRRIRHNFLHSPVWSTDLEGQSLNPSEVDEDEVEATEDGGIALARVSTNINKGPLEVAVSKLWNDDQRQTAAFLWPGERAWTAFWIWSAKFMLVFVVVAAIGRFIFNFDLIVGVALALGGFASLAASPLFSRATGLRQHGALGVFSPMYAAFPLAYDSLYKTLRAVALVRWLTWMPLILLYAAAIAWLSELNTILVLKIAFKIGLMLLALQPGIITLWLSYNCSITRRWPVVLIVLLLLILGGAMFAFILTSGETTVPVAVNLGLLAAIWILAKAAQLLHRTLYRSGAMDLLSKPRTN